MQDHYEDHQNGDTFPQEDVKNKPLIQRRYGYFSAGKKPKAEC